MAWQSPQRACTESKRGDSEQSSHGKNLVRHRQGSVSELNMDVLKCEYEIHSRSQARLNDAIPQEFEAGDFGELHCGAILGSNLYAHFISDYDVARRHALAETGRM